MKGRLGAQAAVTATAHELARIVYLALKPGMTYVRQSQEEYQAQMREKQVLIERAFPDRRVRSPSLHHALEGRMKAAGWVWAPGTVLHTYERSATTDA